MVNFCSNKQFGQGLQKLCFVTKLIHSLTVFINKQLQFYKLITHETKHFERKDYIGLFILGGCQNGSSAGKRRIAENIRTHITASFFVDEAKDTANMLDRNWLAVVSIGGVLLVIAATIFVLKVRYKCMYAKILTKY